MGWLFDVQGTKKKAQLSPINGLNLFVSKPQDRAERSSFFFFNSTISPQHSLTLNKISDRQLFSTE